MLELAELEMKGARTFWEDCCVLAHLPACLCCVQVVSGVHTVILPFVSQLQVTAVGEHKGHGRLPLAGGCICIC